MIVRLAGTLIDVTEDAVVIDRDGVAREVLVPRFAIGELAACRGQEIMLYTIEFLEGNQASSQLVPRMLGFLHAEDRAFFMRFVSVKGIGSRKALKALTEPVRRVAAWIEAADGKALTTLPGIGKRAADLMIASLRGKMKEFAVGDSVEGGEQAAQLTQTQRDALEVLVAWGDPRGEAERWLERAAQLDPDIESPDDWVRLAYRVKTGVAG